MHVRPRSAHPKVGGSHDGALVVRVREPAADGRANAAAIGALAAAFGVPRTAVRIVSGGASRRKVVDVDGPDAALVRTAASLRGPG